MFRCILGGIACSGFLTNFYANIHEEPTKKETQAASSTKSVKKEKSDSYPYKSEVGHIVIGVLALLCISYVQHSIWVTSEAYSSPSIVLAARGANGGRIIFDDFREAYYWLRQNTAEVSLLIHLSKTKF